MWTDLLHRLRAVFCRRAVERELADELRFHLERETEKHVASGMTRDEAARRARLAFGGLDPITEACRDARGVRLVETVVQDVRYGLRTARRSPAFAGAAMATIALSTAAIATVASLGHTLLWRRLSVDRADEIVTVSATRGRPGDGAVSYPDYVAFRDGSRTLTGLAAHYSTAPLFVSVNGNAREVNGAVVSANYFPLLRLQPERGRFIEPDEDRVPDRDRVAVLGHDFWRTWFGGSDDVIGSSLTINGVAFTVVGVAPANVPMMTPMPVNVYIPTMMLRVGYRWCDDSLAPACTTLLMFGRLAEGRTAQDANAELATLAPAAWKGAPIGQNSGILVRQPRGMSEDDQEPRLVAALGAVAVVLWIVCCANLAGLLTAQSAARGTEFAIRVSLGASRRRIVRQVVTESLLLASAGGVAGVLLSRGFIALLAATFFSMDDEGHPLFYDFSQTPAIPIATIASAIAAGIAFSLIPAIRAVQKPGVGTARTAAPRWSTARWLLGAQAAAAVAMVATAALLGASARLVLTGRNYETSHVALMRVRPRLVKYAAGRAQRFQRDVIRRLAAVPSVESATMVGIGSVLSGGTATAALPAWTGDAKMRVRYNEVGPSYFATLRTPILAGREFDDRDTLGSPHVAVVNETLAAQLWPGRSPLGQTVLVDHTVCQVVGLAADVALQARDRANEPALYTPFWQNPEQIDSRIAVRVAGDPAEILPRLAREVHRVDPDVPIAETITLPVRMAGLTRPVRVGAAFVGYAASLATLLTAIGLYGMLGSAVARRTREIGIRLALGAMRRQVVSSIVREGVAVVVTGSMIGLALAIAAARALVHLLYGPTGADWVAYATAVLTVIGVGVLGSLLPARRAAAVEPVTALRQE